MANEENAKNNENMKLDDAQRVKVLSPGMLVARSPPPRSSPPRGTPSRA